MSDETPTLSEQIDALGKRAMLAAMCGRNEELERTIAEREALTDKWLKSMGVAA